MPPTSSDRRLDVERAPRNVRAALALALAIERRTQNFYVDVAENTTDDAMCALAAEMAADESRHIARLERLLAREPDSAAGGAGDVLPLKP
jgi:rubrerythrin